APLVDRGIAGRAFGAAVPRAVVVGAVPVVLGVGLVVLVVVGDQVGEGEPVVAGGEVDRSDGAGPARRVQVAGPGEPGRELRNGGWASAPEVADRVAVLAVPLGP